MKTKCCNSRMKKRKQSENSNIEFYDVVWLERRSCFGSVVKLLMAVAYNIEAVVSRGCNSGFSIWFTAMR